MTHWGTGEGAPWQLRRSAAQVVVTLRRGSARGAGVLLRAWLHSGPAGGPPAAAAVVVDWRRGTLEARAPTSGRCNACNAVGGASMLKSCRPRTSFWNKVRARVWQVCARAPVGTLGA